MGFKRKMRRKGKVVSIEKKRCLLCDVDVHGLVEETEMYLDDLFCVVLDMAAKGVLLPAIWEEEDGTERMVFQLARDLKEARNMRKLLFDRTELSEEEWSEIKGDMNNLLCIALDMAAKGVLLPAICEKEDGSERRVFRLARDIEEARSMRKVLFDYRKLSEEEWRKARVEIEPLLPHNRRKTGRIIRESSDQ